MSEHKILYQPWGGLGDNLQYSTLPEQFAKQGYEFYVHESNVYRNFEIHDLVWKQNPFFKGFSSEKPNCGAMPLKYNNEEFIHNIELSNGALKSDNPFPKIYYFPKIKHEFENKIVLNMHSITTKYDDDVLLKIMNEFPNSIHLSLNAYPSKYKNKNVYNVNTIYEHCDIIASCKKYITLYSGGSVLASAIKSQGIKTDVDVYISNNDWLTYSPNKSYIFDNLKYIIC